MIRLVPDWLLYIVVITVVVLVLVPVAESLSVQLAPATTSASPMHSATRRATGARRDRLMIGSSSGRGRNGGVVYPIVPASR